MLDKYNKMVLLKCGTVLTGAAKTVVDDTNTRVSGQTNNDLYTYEMIQQVQSI